MGEDSLQKQIESRTGSKNPDIQQLKDAAKDPDLQALNAEIPKRLHKQAKKYALENDMYL